MGVGVVVGVGVGVGVHVCVFVCVCARAVVFRIFCHDKSSKDPRATVVYDMRIRHTYSIRIAYV